MHDRSIARRLANRLRRLRWFLRARLGRDFYSSTDINAPSARFGGLEGSGGWTVATTGLGPTSIVYSVGVGDNISFDCDLSMRLKVNVHVFDPTPRSLEWLRRQALPPGMMVHPFGLAGFNGEAVFAPHENPEWISHSMVRAVEGADRETLPVRRLETVMQDLGHDHVDLLKLDIEGAEYAVLDSVLSGALDVRQVLVEFHHRFPEIGWRRTADIVGRMRLGGYRVCHVSPRGEEYTFVRVERVSDRAPEFQPGEGSRVESHRANRAPA